MPDPSPGPPVRNVSMALCACTLAALSIPLINKVFRTGQAFGRPAELTWPAAANTYIARRVQHGGVLYGDWRERPHVPTWYGPALYLPVAYIGRWINADELALNTIARSISLIATLGTAGLIVWLVTRDGQIHPAFAAMAGLLFLASDCHQTSLDVFFRSDSPGTFFTVLGLCLAERSERRWSIPGSLLCFAIAFLYKQSFVACPVAVVIWLWHRGRTRQAVAYAIVGLVGVAGYVALSEVFTHGRYSLNAVQALKGNTTLSNIPDMLSRFIVPTVFSFAVAFYVLLSDWARSKWHLMTIALVISLAAAAALTVRDGSYKYYYGVPFAVSCVLCGRQLAQWWLHRQTDPTAAGILTMAMAFSTVYYVPQAAAHLSLLPENYRLYSNRYAEHQKERQFLRQLADYLNALDGPVLCQYNDLCLYCPRSVLIDTLTFTSMADVGAFDDRRLVKEIRQGRIAAIVLNAGGARTYQSTDTFSRRWRQAMAGAYYPAKDFGGARIYLPVRSTTTKPAPPNKPPPP
ncbi:MAG: hypothetical protein JXQ73_26890 [Phycisphaerae bacterium]|nr:hypothetical protein [Phycisphaerae bacterium]